jgi:flavin-dependent dehydrogenase
MIDVIIAGAGPAGCIAGIVLVRAGVRVLMLDRARFPRPKLCGDSLNPGAVALLDRFELTGFPEERAVPADGIIVTGEAGVRIEGRYPPGVRGRFISRTDLDSWLLEQALSAGVEVQERARVVGAVLSDGVRGREVMGVRVARAPRGECALASRLTIAADGRRSALAFGLGLARHPARPRRWAVGGYFEGVRTPGHPSRRAWPAGGRRQRRVEGGDYQAQLEMLLVELANVSRELRRKLGAPT